MVENDFYPSFIYFEHNEKKNRINSILEEQQIQF